MVWEFNGGVCDVDAGIQRLVPAAVGLEKKARICGVVIPV